MIDRFGATWKDPVSRRQATWSAPLVLRLAAALAALCGPLLLSAAAGQAAERPNILWISCEDINPNLHCYGDPDAVTPTLDKLAAEGIRFTNAFTTGPVCAINRSSVITGMYPTTLGTQYMRCQAKLPPDVKCFSEYLRKAGYYCANNSKTDYNFAVPRGAWDDSSKTADWRGRKPGQPFFFVRNILTTHEGDIWARGKQHVAITRDLTPQQRLDPAKVHIPSYYPDTPEVRRDWANYLENITEMDHEVGQLLAKLQQDGLADDTIVFFWADHGAGLPRAKRWLYDSGLHVPLIVVIPEKFRIGTQGRPGTVDDQLIGFIDLAPTVLNLCGLPIPKHFQGRAFLGPNLTPPREVVFSTRDRMDERTDMSRTIRDQRYRYIRNFMPWMPYTQWTTYAERNATMQDLRRHNGAGQLTATQALFMARRKPVEELFDTQSDPENIHNLAEAPNHEQRELLDQFRKRLDQWQLDTRDLGLLPEAIVEEEGNKLGSRWAILQQPGSIERLKKLQRLAQYARPGILTGMTVSGEPDFAAATKDPDPAVRYWGAIGLYGWSRGKPLVAILEPLLDDPSATVRIAAASEIAHNRDEVDQRCRDVLLRGLGDANPWGRHAAALAIDGLDDPNFAKGALQKATTDSNAYVRNVAKHTLERLKKDNKGAK